MKRIFALLMALLMLALPALAEPMSPFDYTDDILEDGSLIYYFEDLSLQLPAEWHGKVMVKRTDSGAEFYHAETYKKSQEDPSSGDGWLFSLCASVNHSFEELPSWEYVGFSERSAMNYYLMLPTDYRASMSDEDLRAEYDAMLAQTQYVVEHATVYPPLEADAQAGEAASAEAAEAAPAEAEAAEEAASQWTPAQVRYGFEHSMLPRYFYEDPQAMYDAISRVGLYTMWASIATENGVDPTYPMEDCIEHWFTAGENVTFLQIELPQPDANTLCYRIYFVYNAATGDSWYYTVESDTFVPDTVFVCMWTKDRTHMNYGGMDLVKRGDDGYEEWLITEAGMIAEMAGIAEPLTPAYAPAS